MEQKRTFTHQHQGTLTQCIDCHCHSNCLACDGSPTTCTSCNTGLLLNDGTCTATCEYRDGTQCIDCHSNCLTCDGSPTTCTSCNTGLLLATGRIADFDVALSIQSGVSCSHKQGSSLSVEITNIQHGLPQTIEAFVC